MFLRLFVVAGLAALAAVASGETLDRVAVSMGQQVITESQVILDLRVAAFLEQKPVEMSGEAKRKAAQRLVDQFLILREAADSHLTLPSKEATAGLVAPYAAESGYQANLKHYEISEQDLGAYLLAGLRTLTFTDLRFRPDVQVSPEDIRSYYDQLIRQPHSPANPIPAFEDSRDQIEKLLVEQRTLEELDKWLDTARAAARVQYREKAFQ